MSNFKFPLLILLLLAASFQWSFGRTGATPVQQQTSWPERFSASYGFEIMEDHNGLIIVSSVDTTKQAYQLGVRPGMEILGWNTLPIQRKLESMRVKKYRKDFPVMTDDQIRLLILPRGRPGDTAEIFLMTPTGNNRGIRLAATL